MGCTELEIRRASCSYGRLDEMADSSEHIPSGQEVPSEDHPRACPVSAEANLDGEAPRDGVVPNEASIATDDSSDAQASITVESHVAAEPLGAPPMTKSEEVVDDKTEKDITENVTADATEDGTPAPVDAAPDDETQEAVSAQIEDGVAEVNCAVPNGARVPRDHLTTRGMF